MYFLNFIKKFYVQGKFYQREKKSNDRCTGITACCITFTVLQYRHCLLKYFGRKSAILAD